MRNQFLLAPNLVFLNHGSFGACPRKVLEVQHHWQLAMEQNPVEFLGRRSAGLLLQARQALAQAMGATADELVFVPNSTTGVSIVARSFPLQEGDEVLTTDLEYGACDAAWQHVCQQAGAVYRRIKIPLPFDRESVTEHLFSAASSKTRLITFSHITSSTALIFPAAEICAAARKRGIATFVDGAHAPGQIPVNLNAINADFYVGNCHKWLCAPKGSAFLHARTEHHAMLDANVLSWGYAAGTDEQSGFDDFLGKTLFERRMQWQGTRDISAWLAVPAALDFQRKNDWPALQVRCHALAKMALDVLTERFGTQPIAGDEDWAQMVAIPLPPQDPELLRKRLYEESHIEVPVTTHGNQTFLRISVQGYNTLADIERLLAAPALNC